MAKPAIVRVKWIDSSGLPGGWIRDTDLAELVERGPLSCVSIGFLWHKDEQMVIVVPHGTSEGQVDGIMTIPTVAVTEIETLREAEPDGD